MHCVQALTHTVELRDRDYNDAILLLTHLHAQDKTTFAPTTAPLHKANKLALGMQAAD